MFDVICWHEQTQCSDKAKPTCGIHQEKEPESTNWEALQLNSRGHRLSDMSFVILEKVMSDDVLLREERESHYIRIFNSKYKGMNTKT